MYDDRFTLVLNGSDTPITIDDILLDEIEEGLEGDLTNCEGCSSLVADAPPLIRKIPSKVGGIFCSIFLHISPLFAFESCNNSGSVFLCLLLHHGEKHK